MKKNLLLLAVVLISTMACAQKKAVSILGDSYSTYAKSDPKTTDVQDVKQTWWHQLITRQGWKLCVNNSYSGSTIGYHGYSGNDYSKRSFLTRMGNLGCPDIIFIFGATNDSWAGEPVGEYQYEKLSEANFWYFRPAMARMLEWMTNRYVGADIFFLLNDGLREDINESIKTICQHYGVKYIALQNIDKKSGHPSVKGMKQIADQIIAAMQ